MAENDLSEQPHPQPSDVDPQSGDLGSSGGGASAGSDGAGGAQPGGPGSVDALTTPSPHPEVEEARKELMRAFHDKTQQLASERRELELRGKDTERSHQVLQELMSSEWFKKAYAAEKHRTEGQAAELTDEEWEAARSDKRAFQDLIRRTAEGIMEGRMSTSLSRTQQGLAELRAEREFDQMAQRYPDFKELNDAGKFDDLLKDDRSYEEAYALYQLRQRKSDRRTEAVREAERILAERKAAAVTKGGSASPGGTEIITAKSLSDALDQLFAAHANGRTNLKVTRS